MKPFRRNNPPGLVAQSDHLEACTELCEVAFQRAKEGSAMADAQWKAFGFTKEVETGEGPGGRSSVPEAREKYEGAFPTNT